MEKKSTVSDAAKAEAAKKAATRANLRTETYCGITDGRERVIPEKCVTCRSLSAKLAQLLGEMSTVQTRCRPACKLRLSPTPAR